MNKYSKMAHTFLNPLFVAAEHYRAAQTVIWNQTKICPQSDHVGLEQSVLVMWSKLYSTLRMDVMSLHILC